MKLVKLDESEYVFVQKVIIGYNHTVCMFTFNLKSTMWNLRICNK